MINIKVGMRKHLIGKESRNHPSGYNPGINDWYELTDVNREYNIKCKPHSNWGGRKPMWRAKRKKQRKFKQSLRIDINE